MIIYVLNIMGIICLSAFISLEVFRFRKRKYYTKPEKEIPLLLFLYIFSGILAFLINIRPWNYNSETRISGIPFVSAVFELHNGYWRPYVGPMSLPAFFANILFWMLASQALLTAILKLKKKKENF